MRLPIKGLKIILTQVNKKGHQLKLMALKEEILKYK